MASWRDEAKKEILTLKRRTRLPAAVFLPVYRSLAIKAIIDH